MTSQFDPEAFLNQTTSEAGSTKAEPIPVGEYTAMIGEDIKARQWQGKKDPTRSGFALDVPLMLDAPAVAEKLGRQNPMMLIYGIMLDTLPSGGLDMGKGKNLRLNRLREAVGLNSPGQPFNFRMLSGRMVKVMVKHRQDGEDTYAEVDGVAKLG